MSKRNLSEKIKLQSYNDMFGEDENTEIVVQEQIKDVALSELYTFKNHPFKVSDDAKMEEMVESVKQYGILVPAIARERVEGGYELISGHRRHHAATLAGLETMPVMIKDWVIGIPYSVRHRSTGFSACSLCNYRRILLFVLLVEHFNAFEKVSIPVKWLVYWGWRFQEN